MRIDGDFTKSGDIVGTYMQSRLTKCIEEGQLLEHQSYFNFNDNDTPIRTVVAAMYTNSLFSLPCDRGQDD